MTTGDRPRASTLDVTMLAAALVASAGALASWIAWHTQWVGLAIGHFECREEALPRLTRIAVAWPPKVAFVLGAVILALGAAALIVARLRDSRRARIVARIALVLSLLLQIANAAVVHLGLRAGATTFVEDFSVPDVERCACPSDFVCIEECPCQCACDADGRLRVILVDRDTNGDGRPDRRTRLDGTGRIIR